MANDSWSSGVAQPRRRRSRGVLGWLLFLLTAGAAGAFVWYLYLPLRSERAGLSEQVRDREKILAAAQRAAKEAEAQAAELKKASESLAGQLVQTVAEKQKLEADLKRIQDELAAKLDPEIQAGNVRLLRRGNDLVVDLADQILFDPGKTEIAERGKSVLSQLAPTLSMLKGHAIQVGGHTDSTRIKNPATQELYPTNWELSTARATNVVRYLQETGKVPGERLVAMGFAEYKPVGGNSTEAGRKKNRRIEIVLSR